MRTLNDLAREAAEIRESKGFYTPTDIAGELPAIVKLNGDVTLADVMISKLGLVTCEVAEAIEAVRKGDFEHFGEELADVVIRVLDIAYTTGLDLEDEIARKMARNRERPYRHGKAV